MKTGIDSPELRSAKEREEKARAALAELELRRQAKQVNVLYL